MLIACCWTVNQWMNLLFKVFQRGSCRPSYFPRIHSLPGVFLFILPPFLPYSTHYLLFSPPAAGERYLFPTNPSPCVYVCICTHVCSSAFSEGFLYRHGWRVIFSGKGNLPVEFRDAGGPRLEQVLFRSSSLLWVLGATASPCQKGTFVNTPPQPPPSDSHVFCFLFCCAPWALRSDLEVPFSAVLGGGKDQKLILNVKGY